MDVIIDHECCDTSAVKRIAATLNTWTDDSMFHCLYFAGIPITERYSPTYCKYTQKVWEYISRGRITG